MKTSLALMILAVVSILAAPAGGKDTGTYEIIEYRIELEPQADGKVVITYLQTWLVTGGNIPWVTVGTANSDFSLRQGSAKGNVRSIRRQTGGGWSGVRATLDRDYRKGERFEVGFAVTQRRLVQPFVNGYRLNFTPGWYDRAPIGTLRIELTSPCGLEEIETTPAAAVTDAGTLRWTHTDLRAGERFSISIAFPKSAFPGWIEPAAPKRSDKNGIMNAIVVIIMFAIIFPIVLVVIFANRKAMRYGSGGRIGWGGAGSTGTRGSVVSCACACVACACACACAGGGAAGCDRKIYAAPGAARANANDSR